MALRRWPRHCFRVAPPRVRGWARRRRRPTTRTSRSSVSRRSSTTTTTTRSTRTAGYVISDAKDYKNFVKLGEMPLAVTKFGAGPNGETVKMSLTKNETKGMEKKAGFRGGAQNLYEGTVEGLNKGFFGFVMTGDHYYVFDNWNQLASFRKSGQMTTADSGTAPDGKPVSYAFTSTELEKRFQDLNAQ